MNAPFFRLFTAGGIITCFMDVWDSSREPICVRSFGKVMVVASLNGGEVQSDPVGVAVVGLVGTKGFPVLREVLF